MDRRTQALALTAVMAVGLLRGGWWVAVTEVMSPIDEAAHVDYVTAMGDHGAPPKVGRDRVDTRILELAKESPTSQWRPSPVTVDNHDPRWGAFAQSYEGVQPPLYYAVLAVPWKLLHGYGGVATLYILRVVTLLMALCAIPLTWLLAREVFPDRPEIALGACGALVFVGGFNANVANVTNDALVMPLVTAALWLTARTWNKGFQARSAIGVGALVGLSVLAKTTGLVAIPLVALGALGPLWTRGAVARRYVAWGAQAGGVAAVFVIPWLLWNRATYHAWSASAAVDKITGPLQPPVPRTLHGVVMHLKSAVTAFWSPQLGVTRIGHAAVFWTLGGGAILLAGAVFHLRRRPTRDALGLAWMSVAIPLGLLLMIGIIAYVFGGSSSVVGRHLYPTLPALLVAIAAAACTVFRRPRVGLAIVALLVAVGVTLERADDSRYVLGTYTRGAIGPLTPVVGNTRGDGSVASPLRVHLEANCVIAGVGIEFASAPMPTPTVTRVDAGGGTFAFYPVAAPARAVDVDVPAGFRLSATAHHRTATPVASAYCAQPHPAQRRFDALFHPDHPNWPLALVRDWPTGWAVVAWLLAAASALWAWRSVSPTTRREPETDPRS
ncbi:MAG TPA: hypothetical protein VHC63_01140 [Acidimicrobiales bacterium]|nr:hypothetical protein [Acidimicrobiales bacterium]